MNADSKKCHVSYCHHFTSLRLSSAVAALLSSINISILFSETNRPIETKLGKTLHWIVLNKFMVFFSWSEINHRNKQKKGCLCLLYVESSFINKFDEFNKIQVSSYHEVAIIFILKSVVNIFVVVTSYNSI